MASAAVRCKRTTSSGRKLLLVLTVHAFSLAAASDVVRTASPAERGLTEADFPRLQQIADGVYTYEALTGSPDDRYTTNSLIVIGDAGVLVADGQGSPDETAALVAAIGGITDRPIKHVVICSDHGDHTAGNSAFPATASFIAHTNSAATLAQTAQDPEHDDSAPQIIMPTVLIDDALSLSLGDRQVRILFLGRAHTGGDLFVWLPDDDILFASEVFLNHMFSGYRSAYPTEWLQAMERAEDLAAGTLLPGHGFIDAPAILAEEWLAYKDHLQVVLDEVTRLHEAGRSVDEAIAEADFGIYANWSGADFQGPIGVRRIYAELNGELRD